MKSWWLLAGAVVACAGGPRGASARSAPPPTGSPAPSPTQEEPAAPEAWMAPGPPAGAGMEEMAKVVAVLRPALRACFARSKSATAPLRAILSLDGRGEVKELSFDPSDVGSTPLKNCLSTKLSAARFPAADDELRTVVIPIVHDPTH